MSVNVINLLTFLLFSCSSLFGQSLNERIQYSVQIIEEKDYLKGEITDQLPDGPRQAWLGQVLTEALSGKLAVYDALDEALVTPLTLAQVDKILVKRDTIGTDPGTVMSEVVGADNIVRIKFIERWVLDKKKGLTKEVVAFAPMVAVTRSDGGVLGYKSLFWIKND